MAGENVLPITECPDMISETFAFQFSIAEDFQNTYLFYCERDTIVDAAHCICNVTDASGDITLNTASSGVASAGSAISSVLTPGAAGVPTAFTMTETANLIPAGNWIGVEHDGDADSADLVGVMIQLRLRTRIR